MPYNPQGKLQFNHETGFHGVVKIGTKPLEEVEADDPTTYSSLATILATSGSCSIAHNPIYSTGLWGAGWYNIAENVAYSNNVLEMSGSVGYELIVGPVFDSILSFGFENRAANYGHGFVILPDGLNGFMGPGWCSGVDMSASSGANITGNIQYQSAILARAEELIGNNFITKPLGTIQGENELKYGVGYHPGLLNPPEGDHEYPPPAAKGEEFLGMYPFWASAVYAGTVNGDSVNFDYSDPLPNVQDWSAQYSSSVEFMTLCSGYTDFKGPITPDYIMVGSMSGSGSLTLVGLSEQISPAKIYDQKAYTMVVRPNSALTDETKWGKITLPSVIYSSVDISTTTGATLVTASISFNSLGDGTKPPMAFEKFA